MNFKDTVRLWLSIGLIAVLFTGIVHGQIWDELNTPFPKFESGGFLTGKPLTTLEIGIVHVLDFRKADIDFDSIEGDISVNLVSPLTKLHNRLGGRDVIFVTCLVEMTVAPKVQFENKRGYRVAIDSNTEKNSAAQKGRTHFLNLIDFANVVEPPVVMIVGRDGKLAWTGLEENVQDVLELVVAGNFDPSEYRLKQGRIQQLWLTIGEFEMGIQPDQQNGKIPDFDSYYAEFPELEGELLLHEFRINAKLGRIESAYECARQRLDSVTDASSLSQIATTISQDDLFASNRDLTFALEIAKQSVQLTNRRDPGCLRGLAWIHHLNGDSKSAIEIIDECTAMAETEYDRLLLREDIERFRGNN